MSDSDIVVLSSEEETETRLSQHHPNSGTSVDELWSGDHSGGNSDADDEPVSILSVGDDDDDISDTSDCEIVDVEDARGEEKWRNVHSPVKMLNALLQAGYTDPRQLLSRMFGMDSKTVPQDTTEQWGLLLTLLTEPNPRPRLRHINSLENVLDLLRSCQSILVVTGAGVSVSCGIPDFRSRDGIYARLAQDYPDLSSPQAMFDMTYFLQNPSPFFKFAKEIFPGQFSPSPTHQFVGLLEAKNKLLRNYSQNIDTLEQVAGITRLLQCHGSFITATCVSCKYRVPGTEIKEPVYDQEIPYCPRCRPQDSHLQLTGSSTQSSISPEETTVKEQGTEASEPCYGVLKPDIVFFGEDLPNEFHDALADDIHKTDLVLVIGSSLKVRPVAHIPNAIPENVPQVLINREPLSNHDFDVELLGDCDIIVGELCMRLNWELPNTATSQMRSLVPLCDLVEQRSKGGLKPKMDLIQRCPPSEQSTSSPPASIQSTSDSLLNQSTSSGLVSENKIADTVKPSCQVPAPTSTTEVIDMIDCEVDVIEVNDSDDDDGELNDLWDVAAFLPPNTYTHIPPNQYVFPGAEMFLSQSELCDLDGTSPSTSLLNSPTHHSPGHASVHIDTLSMTRASETDVNPHFLQCLRPPQTEKSTSSTEPQCVKPSTSSRPSQSRVSERVDLVDMPTTHNVKAISSCDNTTCGPSALPDLDINSKSRPHTADNSADTAVTTSTVCRASTNDSPPPFKRARAESPHLRPSGVSY